MAIETTHPSFPLTSLGDVSSALGAFTLRLRDEHDVAKVERQCVIVGGEQPSIEWLIDADLTSSDSLSWRLRLHWSDDAWMIEADTRSSSGGASPVELEMAPRASEPASSSPICSRPRRRSCAPAHPARTAASGSPRPQALRLRPCRCMRRSS